MCDNILICNDLFELRSMKELIVAISNWMMFANKLNLVALRIYNLLKESIFSCLDKLCLVQIASKSTYKNSLPNKYFDLMIWSISYHK